MAPWKLGERIKEQEFLRIISDNSLVVMSARINKRMNAKAWVVSIAATFITAYGALYGAHLKTQYQARQVSELIHFYTRLSRAFHRRPIDV